MLKKFFRLLHQKDFERVFRNGRSQQKGSIACRSLPNGRAHMRVGFSISKKYVPTAVGRNRIRRRIAQCFFSDKTEMSVGVDIVFFLRDKLSLIDNRLEESVREMIRQIRA